MTEPLVSIISPTYNHEPFIAACIESVLAQSYSHWEMTIIDDGSTDGTVRIARCAGDPRIRVIEQTHRGIWHLQDTYNQALRQSSGSLVAVLEGDDVWPTDRLERQVPAMSGFNVVLAYGPADVIDAAGRLVDRAVPVGAARASIMSNAPPGTALRLLLGGNQITACTVLIDRAALESIGGFCQPPAMPAVDYATWLRLATLGEFRVLDRPMGRWRTHDGQVTRRQHFDLTRGASQWAVDFFQTLAPEFRIRSGWTLPRLVKQTPRFEAAAHCLEARFRLRDGDRRAAAALFRPALRWGDWRTRRNAAIGLLCLRTGLV